MKTTAQRTLHFTDRRTPQQLRWDYERMYATPFAIAAQKPRLEFHAKFKFHGLPCEFHLVFEADGETDHHYTQDVRFSWGDFAKEIHAEMQATSSRWFNFWGNELKTEPAPPEKLRDNGRYRALVQEAVDAEAIITSIPAIKEMILTEVKKGASFSIGHKEGGTNIGFGGGRFYASDYGENDGHTTFDTDAAFLDFLRRFYDWETSRSVYPDKVPEEIAWRLILRKMNPAR